MNTRPRRAIPASEKSVRKVIGAPALEDGGKLPPAKFPGSGIRSLTEKEIAVAKKIVQRQRGGKKIYCVEAETTGRSFGCFPTKAGASRRLAQIERFKVKKAEPKAEAKDEQPESVAKRLFIPIVKTNHEEQTITGIVLQPEVVDAQGDIMSADVIRKAAHKFLADHNRVTKLGLMHKDFKKHFELFESFIIPIDLVIGDRQVKAGSWIIVVHVLTKKIWDQIKSGKLGGFSIGGKAKVAKLNTKAA